MNSTCPHAGDSRYHPHGEDIPRALRALKKKMQREGVFRDQKLARYYEKPGDRKRRKRAEALRRAHKAKRRQRIAEGELPKPKSEVKPKPLTARTCYGG
jgi:small subunit ribosomal protein S21